MNTIFLTSMPLEDKSDVASPKLNNINSFVTQIKQVRKKESNNFVYFAAEPNMYEKNDFYAELYYKAFANSQLEFKNCILVDGRNCSKAEEMVKSADIVVLGGGKLPDQNRFFKDMDLRLALRGYDGIIIGMSAGSMNLADTVFDFPELDEQIGNPHFLEGLGYTDINIIPHYNPSGRNYILESGLDAWAAFALPHSYKINIYVLVDGAHILIKNGHSEIYGEAYLLKDSVLRKICSNGETYTV